MRASRTIFSITNYVFRWLGCEFIKGYMEATSPDSHQPDLAIGFPSTSADTFRRSLGETSADACARRGDA